MEYVIYILRNTNNKLYIGQTNNLQRRLKEHDTISTKSAKYIKDNKNFVLVHTEVFASRLDAMRREKQLKKWSRVKKDALIAGDIELLKKV